jgi:hypothetical protein
MTKDHVHEAAQNERLDSMLRRAEDLQSKGGALGIHPHLIAAVLIEDALRDIAMEIHKIWNCIPEADSSFWRRGR